MDTQEGANENVQRLIGAKHSPLLLAISPLAAPDKLFVLKLILRQYQSKEGERPREHGQ